ncbi:MAG: histidine--tRNA ligase [Rickettsiales bacterium]|nr:histidine--tRNA ligase [Rickettsiales bacterium]
MTNPLQPVRGTHDLIGEAMQQHRFIEHTARDVAARYGFAEMSTPIFEFTDVFHRTLGETSDVISKETYSFADRGGDSITLRPEFTASVVRAFISNGLTQQLPFKAFYAGPAFRYERPQKGRLRQFHQIGVEVLGADAPWFDVEVIACGYRILKALGLENHVTLEMNSLGDPESRAAYRAALVAYFSEHSQDLSEDSQRRLQSNPLRILDSKDEGDRALIAEAPELFESFTAASHDWIAEVQEGLVALDVPYTLNPRIVRGLDYYTHTVFEFTTTALGAQGTVLAGGRYNGLVAMMGGPDIPGIGFAAGVERLAMLMTQAAPQIIPAKPLLLFVNPIGSEAAVPAHACAELLRGEGFCVEYQMNKKIGKAFEKAEKMGARYVMVLGDDELARQAISVKDLSTGQQVTMAQSDLPAWLRAR